MYLYTGHTAKSRGDRIPFPGDPSKLKCLANSETFARCIRAGYQISQESFSAVFARGGFENFGEGEKSRDLRKRKRQASPIESNSGQIAHLFVLGLLVCEALSGPVNPEVSTIAPQRRITTRFFRIE